MNAYISASLDLYVSKGSVFSKQITIRDVNFVPFNITPFISISTKVTRYYGDGVQYIMGSSIITPAIGLVQVDMAALETAKLKFDRYVYSIYLTGATETVEVVSGQILMLTF